LRNRRHRHVVASRCCTINIGGNSSRLSGTYLVVELKSMSETKSLQLGPPEAHLGRMLVILTRGVLAASFDEIRWVTLFDKASCSYKKDYVCLACTTFFLVDLD